MYYHDRFKFLIVSNAGVKIAGPARNPHVDDGSYIVDCVLSRPVTRIDKWSVAVDGRTLRHYTMKSLPDFMKDAVTQIAIYADVKNLRDPYNFYTSGRIATPEKDWPEEFKNVGWLAAQEKQLANNGTYTIEQLFVVVVTPEQLDELRKNIPDDNVAVNDLPSYTV